MNYARKRMNRGTFTEHEYRKTVNFSKAVLWKDRELSLPVDIMQRIFILNIEKIVFTDMAKKEVWTFKVSKVKECMTRKQEGQEAQFYFPIDIAKKTPYVKTKYKIVENKAVPI